LQPVGLAPRPCWEAVPLSHPTFWGEVTAQVSTSPGTGEGGRRPDEELEPRLRTIRTPWALTCLSGILSRTGRGKWRGRHPLACLACTVPPWPGRGKCRAPSGFALPARPRCGRVRDLWPATQGHRRSTNPRPARARLSA